MCIQIITDSDGVMHVYTCCRDGKAKENCQPRKTPQTRKHSGTRKLDDYCISRMMVTEKKSSGKVTVQFIRTHTNHTPGIGESKHLRLPEAIKQEVKEKYAQGIQVEAILDGMYNKPQVSCSYI